MTDMLKYACLICFTNVLNVEGERPTYADAWSNQFRQLCIGVFPKLNIILRKFLVPQDTNKSDEKMELSNYIESPVEWLTCEFHATFLRPQRCLKTS